MSRHLVVPLGLDGDHFATVADGSLDEVTQNVRVILGTRRGERLVVPEFGIDDPTFRLSQRVPNEGELEAAVGHWDERAGLEVSPSLGRGTGEVTVDIQVSMRRP